MHQYHTILAACNIQRELLAIFKENELASNIAQSQYFVVLMQNCFIVWLKDFVALHNDSVVRQNFLSQNLSHHTATFVIRYEG